MLSLWPTQMDLHGHAQESMDWLSERVWSHFYIRIFRRTEKWRVVLPETKAKESWPCPSNPNASEVGGPLDPLRVWFHDNAIASENIAPES